MQSHIISVYFFFVFLSVVNGQFWQIIQKQKSEKKSIVGNIRWLFAAATAVAATIAASASTTYTHTLTTKHFKQTGTQAYFFLVSLAMISYFFFIQHTAQRFALHSCWFDNVCCFVRGTIICDSFE